MLLRQVGQVPIFVMNIRTFVCCIHVQHVSLERHEACHVAPLALDHEGRHGLQFHFLRKSSMVLVTLLIHVIGDFVIDKNVALARLKPLEIARDGVGNGHLEEKAPCANAYLFPLITFLI